MTLIQFMHEHFMALFLLAVFAIWLWGQAFMAFVLMKVSKQYEE